MDHAPSTRFAILGLGRFGSRLALDLSAEGADVTALDNDMQRVEALKEYVAEAIQVECTDSDAMAGLNLTHVDVAIVGFGENQEVSILATAILRDIGVPMIVARAGSDLHRRILRRVGAHRVIDPETDAARSLAKSLLSFKVVIKAELADGYQLAEIAAPEALWGQSVGQLRFRQRFDLMIVGVQRQMANVEEDGRPSSSSRLLPSPGPDFELKAGDTLVVVGPGEAVEELATLGNQLPPVGED
ncbi:TrkA family potassium uptake protein [Candidatus Fermentibacteria bacterium]|nr:TrkA family potassium uptake protein [Candidatus Fermentibacteria bacterium]